MRKRVKTSRRTEYEGERRGTTLARGIGRTRKERRRRLDRAKTCRKVNEKEKEKRRKRRRRRGRK